ncbi:hypothetical protein [Sunxiuqinia sp. sy24]|uniref:hypothetical protein n=1 Tax=Sunxiuqinia sp. sy24 TaxID=3461495 RepID=UPI004045E039
MSKKTTPRVIGFGANFQANDQTESTPQTPDESPETFSFEEQLVGIVLKQYDPAGTVAEATEQKSSTELIDEMESVIEPEKNKLYVAMTDAGFQLHYTGESFVWLLKEKS